MILKITLFLFLVVMLIGLGANWGVVSDGVKYSRLVHIWIGWGLGALTVFVLAYSK